MSTQTKEMTKASKHPHANTPPDSPEIAAKDSNVELLLALNIIQGLLDKKSTTLDDLSFHPLPPPPSTPSEFSTERVRASKLKYKAIIET